MFSLTSAVILIWAASCTVHAYPCRDPNCKEPNPCPHDPMDVLLDGNGCLTCLCGHVDNMVPKECGGGQYRENLHDEYSFLQRLPTYQYMIRPCNTGTVWNAHACTCVHAGAAMDRDERQDQREEQ